MISLASSSGDGQLNKFVNNFLLSSKTSKEVSCTRFFEKIFLSYRYFESNKIIAEQRKSRDFINNMSGHDFELFVRDLLIEMGITCDVTRASGDFGADIIASLKGKKIAIQCKRYNKNIGYSAVQEVLAGKSYYKCDEAWVLSNARFTKQASQGARETGVRLINVFDLQQYGLSKLLNGFQAQFNF